MSGPGTTHPGDSGSLFQPRVVAALYVTKGGVYYGLPDVDPWDEKRDARLYDGPHPVVAHPPCARWSRWAGFCEVRYGLRRGDDGGCFEAALRAVRSFGGVLEHPAYSTAWDAFMLPEPTWRGGWSQGICGGWTCYVEQGRYGLPVKKATWLYAYGTALPELRWGWTPDAEAAWPYRWHSPRGPKQRDEVPKSARAATTPGFRDALIGIARSARIRSEAVA